MFWSSRFILFYLRHNSVQDFNVDPIYQYLVRSSKCMCYCRQIVAHSVRIKRIEERNGD